ncbi:hypothetical protein OE88DRAFT_1661182 [Heliocybe sulcata]|uniref:Uncharacterized protein n=1 Tax=Heliocybe sulcata TaxID=5364 RepID=A0A5C3MYS2_9AGAM|nr:hypothetical protein OE88DRAFT_1661182 [Heliocybe sulcata]
MPSANNATLFIVPGERAQDDCCLGARTQARRCYSSRDRAEIVCLNSLLPGARLPAELLVEVCMIYMDAHGGGNGTDTALASRPSVATLLPPRPAMTLGKETRRAPLLQLLAGVLAALASWNAPAWVSKLETPDLWRRRDRECNRHHPGRRPPSESSLLLAAPFAVHGGCSYRLHAPFRLQLGVTTLRMMGVVLLPLGRRGTVVTIHRVTAV